MFHIHAHTHTHIPLYGRIQRFIKVRAKEKRLDKACATAAHHISRDVSYTTLEFIATMVRVARQIYLGFADSSVSTAT
jgi:hypothetical protein